MAGDKPGHDARVGLERRLYIPFANTSAPALAI
jgi:hypothetical protein